jgi:hypothetical protein
MDKETIAALEEEYQAMGNFSYLFTRQISENLSGKIENPYPYTSPLPDFKVLSNKQVTVIRPTPPGTGVI